jgi:hypothetical protein
VRGQPGLRPDLRFYARLLRRPATPLTLLVASQAINLAGYWFERVRLGGDWTSREGSGASDSAASAAGETLTDVRAR